MKLRKMEIVINVMANKNRNGKKGCFLSVLKNIWMRQNGNDTVGKREMKALQKQRIIFVSQLSKEGKKRT